MTEEYRLPDFIVKVIIEPDNGRFHAYCPALKGLHVDGDTEEEALESVTDAAIAYLQSLIKHGDPIPVGVITHKKSKLAPIFRRHHQRVENLVLSSA